MQQEGMRRWGVTDRIEICRCSQLDTKMTLDHMLSLPNTGGQRASR